MPHKVGWYQANRVVIVKVYEVTLQDVCCINEDLVRYLDAGKKPTHLIIDLSEMRKHPTNVMHLKQALSFMKHPRLGYMVVVGASALASTLATILMGFFGVNHRKFKNLNDAHTFLRQYDRRLVNSFGDEQNRYFEL